MLNFLNHMCGAHKLILLFLVTLIILHAMFLVTHSNSRKQGKSSHKTLDNYCRIFILGTIKLFSKDIYSLAIATVFIFYVGLTFLCLS